MRIVFLHISFDIHSDINRDNLKKQFDTALDWIQYIPNCWIVRTEKTAQEWSDMIKPLTGAEDSWFVCRLDLSERQGWLPKWVWDWIYKY